MSKKQDAFYFQNFIECAEAACSAAKLLKKTLNDFHIEKISDRISEIHQIEHSADEKKHLIVDKLAKAFIAPIEREDIVALSQNIDDITDKIEDVLIRIYINHIEEIQPDAISLMEVVLKCCEEVRNLLEDFADFKHSKTLKDHIIRINALEEEADQLFISSMHKLHANADKNPLHIIAWREIYEYLEKCSDACEHVADQVESVVMKNS